MEARLDYPRKSRPVWGLRLCVRFSGTEDHSQGSQVQQLPRYEQGTARRWDWTLTCSCMKDKREILDLLEAAQASGGVITFNVGKRTYTLLECAGEQPRLFQRQ